MDRVRSRVVRSVRTAAGAVAVTVAVAAGAASSAAQDPPPGVDPPPKAGGPDATPVAPRDLPDAEKATRLAAIVAQWEDHRRNQDLVPVRTRRNAVVLAGDMRYAPAAKFLRRVFDDDRDTTTCVAALVAIGKSGDQETIEYATRKAIALVKERPVFVASLPRMFSHVESATAREWIASRIPDHRDDDVTASIVEAVGEARAESALPALLAVLGRSKDAAVRFEALRACGKCGRREAVSRLLPYLADADWRLRMGAIEGLAYAGQPEAIGEIRKLIVRTEEPIVVETAIEAVARLGTRDAFEPLVESLRVARLRARQKARAALRSLAKLHFQQEKDYQVDHAAWSSWWNKTKLGGNPDDPSFAGKETVSYFKFPVESDRVLFILDVSGSMMWPDAPRDSEIRPADWDGRRIDLAHRELFRSLRALAAQNRGRIPKKTGKGDAEDIPAVPSEQGDEPPTLFNVATFSGGVVAWQKEVVLASEENVESAIAWLEKQLPRGGTATFDALAFGIAQKHIDTVCFLSDGVPSLGKFEERETILSELRKLNRFRRISINTVALIVGLSPIESARKYEDPDDMADILSRIAAENQGRFANESKQ